MRGTLIVVTAVASFVAVQARAADDLAQALRGVLEANDAALANGDLDAMSRTLLQGRRRRRGVRLCARANQDDEAGGAGIQGQCHRRAARLQEGRAGLEDLGVAPADVHLPRA